MTHAIWPYIAQIEQDICDIEGCIATLRRRIEQLYEDGGDVRLPAALMAALVEELDQHHRLRMAIFRHGLTGR